MDRVHVGDGPLDRLRAVFRSRFGSLHGLLGGVQLFGGRLDGTRHAIDDIERFLNLGSLFFRALGNILDGGRHFLGGAVHLLDGLRQLLREMKRVFRGFRQL
jgi:hypothetical protein